MGLFNPKLIDQRSVRIRFLQGLLWSAVMLPIAYWVFEFSFPKTAILAGAFLYMSFSGFLIDCWKLRHPDFSRESERNLRLVAAAAGVSALILLICLS
jgi:hypothetical protein